MKIYPYGKILEKKKYQKKEIKIKTNLEMKMDIFLEKFIKDKAYLHQFDKSITNIEYHKSSFINKFEPINDSNSFNDPRICSQTVELISNILLKYFKTTKIEKKNLKWISDEVNINKNQILKINIICNNEDKLNNLSHYFILCIVDNFIYIIQSYANLYSLTYKKFRKSDFLSKLKTMNLNNYLELFICNQLSKNLKDLLWNKESKDIISKIKEKIDLDDKNDVKDEIDTVYNFNEKCKCERSTDEEEDWIQRLIYSILYVLNFSNKLKNNLNDIEQLKQVLILNSIKHKQDLKFKINIIEQSFFEKY